MPSAAHDAYARLSANGTNVSKNTVATFAKAGTYIFTVTIRDVGGHTALSNIQVTVTVGSTG